MRAPAQGGEREEQADPPRKKNGNKQTGQTRKKKGGVKEKHTAVKRRSNSKRGGQTPQPGNTEGDTHGASPKEHRGTDLPHPATPNGEQHPAGGKDTPNTPAHTPLGKWRAEKKTSARPKRKGKGGRRRRDARPGQAAEDITKPRHDRAKNHTTPRSPEKNKKGGGGADPTHSKPPHTPTPQAANQKVAVNGRGAFKGPHAPTAKPEEGGVQAKLKPTHTRHKLQPGKAESDQYPCPDTHTLDPSQDWRGYR